MPFGPPGRFAALSNSRSRLSTIEREPIVYAVLSPGPKPVSLARRRSEAPPATAPATVPSEGEVSARARAHFDGRPTEPERTSIDVASRLRPQAAGPNEIRGVNGGACGGYQSRADGCGPVSDGRGGASDRRPPPHHRRARVRDARRGRGDDRASSPRGREDDRGCPRRRLRPRGRPG